MQATERDYFLIILWGTSVLLLLGASIVMFILQYQKKHKAHLQQKRELQRELLQSQLEIKEQVLQHMAYELHDNLGQVASLIKINLNTLRLEDTTAAAIKVENTKELVRQLISDLKTISSSLSGDRIVQRGFIHSILDEIERVNKIGHFIINFSHQGEDPELNTNTSIILFRIFQEMINNALKHSGATQINIVINSSKKLFTLVYDDNGVGFNLEESIQKGGAGLMNLTNRSRLIAADLEINSKPGKGTVITVTLPLTTNGTP